MDLEPISLPAGWDAARDCAYFDERWDAVPSYAAALGEWMRFHHGAHVRTLNTALRYFRGHDADRTDMALGGLTPGEKVALLQEIAARSPRVAANPPAHSQERAADGCLSGVTEFFYAACANGITLRWMSAPLARRVTRRSRLLCRWFQNSALIGCGCLQARSSPVGSRREARWRGHRPGE